MGVLGFAERRSPQPTMVLCFGNVVMKKYFVFILVFLGVYLVGCNTLSTDEVASPTATVQNSYEDWASVYAEINKHNYAAIIGPLHTLSESGLAEAQYYLGGN